MGAAGTDFIDFFPNHQTLKIENKALSSHNFGNNIYFFASGDKIDLPGLRFHTHAKATYDTGSGLLTVKSGNVTDTLTLLSPDAGTFKVKDDGHGGTKIILKPPSAKADAQIAAENLVPDHHNQGHHAASASMFALAEDSFHFKGLAEPGRLGLSETLDALIDQAHTGSPFLDAGGHQSLTFLAERVHHDAGMADLQRSANGEAVHASLGHHAHLLALHDFIL